MSQQPTLSFTRKYEDLSTDNQWKFRFMCDRCGDGFNAAAITKPEPDADFSEAVREEVLDSAKTSFRQCLRCGHWVCRVQCWHSIRCVCENCAASPYAMMNEEKKTDEQVYSSILGAVCAQCDALLEQGSPVCPECGHRQA